ncbi:hypothetical protein GYA93_11700 [Gordonia desulfuricans]|uniref:Uncharacterized protein n=1 Tax=Gordonia desulfuricans TaxID=89051 RepID=A0A7K3LQ96_9ACTN|nr:hypothetical protein [Gordonia desulfuricans]NDK90241.1 hypothetical protein [Gordonia desulfuricans]
MTTALYTTILAAQQEPQGPEFGKASPLGLLVIIVLLICTALLIWSMNRQLKKLPKNFDTDHPEADQAFDEGTDTVTPDASDPSSAAADGTAAARKSAGT